MLSLSSKPEVTIFLLLLLVAPAIRFITALSSNATLETITSAQPLPKDGVLVSPSGDFKLQFFSPGNQGSRYYLGIWYRGEVVWVANREKPLPTTATGFVKIIATPGSSAALVVTDDKTGAIFWSSANAAPNGTRSTGNATSTETVSARLEDSGNLVLRDGPTSVVWQSFDYPTDTLLPDMKLGWNARKGIRWYLRSGSSSDDPSPGRYTFSIEPGPVPQVFLRGPGGASVAQFGYWNGKCVSAVPETLDIAPLTFEYVADDEQVYISYNLPSPKSRMVLDPPGVLHLYVWPPQGKTWMSLGTRPHAKCDYYGSCGPDTVCDIARSSCSCLKGYGPVGTSKGCVRKTAPDCRKADVFEKIPRTKLPDMTNATVDMSMTPERCQQTCAVNCSCIAYSIADIKSNSGCIMWNGEMLDLEQFSTITSGQDLFVRQSVVDPLQADMTNTKNEKKSKRKITLVAIIITSMIFMAFVLLILISLRKRRATKRREKGRKGTNEEINKWGEEVALFDLSMIVSATNNFALLNKIGQGGFGVVYKGTINNGQQIAVKRLSTTSRQGIDEFMNEVKLIARLQHKNLVRLLGCCIDENERVLVYEYMQNKSLDKFIFGKCKDISLDWTHRVNIIHGIARGLLYLHEDSRLKIVHRDLKAANVLLDGLMNPKISDFGTARIFEADQKEENTKRVIGTVGYMSPEYAIEGKFSTMSDVFSFGVILLEIISGMENGKSKQIPCTYDEETNLLLLAWRLWQEGEGFKLLDASLVGKCPDLEVTRYIQIGLLCVQESPVDRPTMSTVVLMLSSDVHIPEPTLPGIFHGGTNISTNCHSPPLRGQESLALITITETEGR